MRPDYKLAVDIGGTFTDGVLQDASSNELRLAKALTTYDDPGNAVTTVVRALLDQLPDRSATVLGDVVHATTLVTNAIIARKGARAMLLVTEGFADTLDIRREDRYDLFDLDLKYPEPLVTRGDRLEVAERIGVSGDVLTALADQEVRRLVDLLKEQSPEAVCICLLHAYVNPAHEEQLVAAISEALPGVPISASSQVAREIREFERMSTVAANAYVQPLTSAYLRSLATRFNAEGANGALRIMVSSGGFTSPEFAAAQPVKLLESGPAAGVLSAVNTAQVAGVSKLLAFDMGGTTAKACVAIDGAPEITNLFEAGRMKRFAKGSGLPIIVPSIDLIEIGAGGGSIARKNELGLLQVGPESASSEPGPACYGRGGENPTVTDADLQLGYLDPDFFLGGTMTLDVAASEAATQRLADSLGMQRTDIAFGIVNLVNENMAGAARVHVAEKGLDPRDFTMVGTGGAGPVHVVEVAHKLGIKRVLCPVAAGNGSCLGLLVAPARVDQAWSKVELLSAVDWSAAQATLDDLFASALEEMNDSGIAAGDVSWSLSVEMRFEGQGDSIPVPFEFGPLTSHVRDRAVENFKTAYSRIFGDLLLDAPIEVTTWRLIGVAEKTTARFQTSRASSATKDPTPLKTRSIFLPDQGSFAGAPVYDRYTLAAGVTLQAPLILQETESTLVVARPATVSVLPDLTVSVELD